MKNNKQIIFSILRPGGNDTALVRGALPMKEKQRINNLIMKRYPNVEQVGFYYFDSKTNLNKLEMAGGEFCGNALRSLAYLLQRGRTGTLKLAASGTDQILTVGVTRKNEAFAQMPILSSFSSVKKINKNLYEVKLSGITHLITPLQGEADPKLLKDTGFNLLKENNLDQEAAAGVMFWSKRNKAYRIDPVVWVRDIQTLFYESACASGTTALGLWFAKDSTFSKTVRNIQQPSGESIKITIVKDTNKFRKAVITGPIEIYLKGGEII